MVNATPRCSYACIISALVYTEFAKYREVAICDLLLTPKCSKVFSFGALSLDPRWGLRWPSAPFPPFPPSVATWRRRWPFASVEIKSWLWPCPVTLTLTRWLPYTSLTRIPWRCAGWAKMNLLRQGFRKLSSGRHTCKVRQGKRRFVQRVVVNTTLRRSGMARVPKGSHSVICTPRVAYIR